MDVSRRGVLRAGGALAAALPLALVAGRAGAAGTGVLASGQSLPPGQRLLSPDGAKSLVLQGDGNLVLYGPRGAIWSSRTQGIAPARLVMQGDGNLVLYDTAGRARWYTATAGGTGRAGAHLQLQDDANAVVVLGHQPLWSSQGGKVGFPAYHPNSLRNVGTATQMVVAVGDAPSSTSGVLHTWQIASSGVWQQVFGTMPMRSGYAGWKVGTSRVQGDGSSPAGTYTLTEAYGLAANPGTTLPYTRVGSSDYRSGDPRDPQTYNVRQPSASGARTWRADTDNSERFADYPTQYQYLVNIDFCTPAPSSLHYDSTHGEYVSSAPPPVGRGFAIYLHIDGAGSTAGCLSLPAGYLAEVMKWLRPAAAPRIAMAPASWLGSV